MLKVILVSMMLTLTVGFGVVAWLSLRPPSPPLTHAQTELAPPPPARMLILAAARPMQAGSLLKPEDIATLEMAPGAMPDGARLDTASARAELTGAMTRRTLAAQQALLSADLLRPTDGGFLAAVLAPHHRAVSVAVDTVSGTAGLIWPGDRVDLILAQTLDEQSTPAGRRTFAETVLRDLRVIAVDQQLAHGAPDAATQANRTVTLEVLPEAAERVAVAVRLGRVVLTVRAADTAQADASGLSAARSPLVHEIASTTRMVPKPSAPAPVPTTWGQDVSPGLAPTRSVTAGATVRVFQGAVGDKEFKFQ